MCDGDLLSFRTLYPQRLLVVRFPNREERRERAGFANTSEDATLAILSHQHRLHEQNPSALHSETHVSGNTRPPNHGL
jgi:hypothetical protein